MVDFSCNSVMFSCPEFTCAFSSVSVCMKIYFNFRILFVVQELPCFVCGVYLLDR